MTWVSLGSETLIKEGELVDATIQGSRLALCRVGGTLFAIAGTCPHAGAPLGQGHLDGHEIVCPWHAWAFDCRTGQFGYSEASRVRTHAIEVRAGEIWVELTSDAGTA